MDIENQEEQHLEGHARQEDRGITMDIDLTEGPSRR